MTAGAALVPEAEVAGGDPLGHPACVMQIPRTIAICFIAITIAVCLVVSIF